jgi:hypothetical protein
MELRTRQLRNSLKRAKAHIIASGLTPRLMSKWADQNLIRLLNDPSEAGAAVVTRIVETCLEAHQLATEIQLGVSTDELLKGRISELVKTLSYLRTLISRYKWIPVVQFVDLSNLAVHYEIEAGRGTSSRECTAIQWLFAHFDVTYRVRRCRECQKWFFGVTDHQKYCRDNCRKLYASRSKDFKTRRKEYMRRYRKQERARQLHAEASAKRR